MSPISSPTRVGKRGRQSPISTKTCIHARVLKSAHMRIQPSNVFTLFYHFYVARRKCYLCSIKQVLQNTAKEASCTQKWVWLRSFDVHYALLYIHTPGLVLEKNAPNKGLESCKTCTSLECTVWNAFGDAHINSQASQHDSWDVEKLFRYWRPDHVLERETCL